MSDDKKKGEVEEVEFQVESVETGDIKDLPEEIQDQLNVPTGPKEVVDEEPEENVKDDTEPEVEEEKEEDKIVDLTEEIEEDHSADDPEMPDMSMGNFPDYMTDHMIGLIQKINEAKDLRELFQMRRKIRYRLFRIRDGGKIGDQHDKGLKAFMENQFENGMTWSNFTFDWDVAPNNPLEIIPSSIHNYDWIEKGGKFDGADRRYPPAFTKQA